MKEGEKDEDEDEDTLSNWTSLGVGALRVVEKLRPRADQRVVAIPEKAPMPKHRSKTSLGGNTLTGMSGLGAMRPLPASDMRAESTRLSRTNDEEPVKAETG